MADRFTPTTVVWGNSTSLVNALNDNFEDIADLLDTFLSRTDTVNPNFMDTNLDMNGYRITNLPAPVNASDAVRLSDLADVVAGGVSALYYTSLELDAGQLDNRYYTETEVDALLSGISADHGALNGLGDDDHTQYHNNARGDARYYLKSEVDSAIAAALNAILPSGMIAALPYTPLGTTVWLPCNGSYVGSAASGSTYASAIYNTLFNVIWNNYPGAVVLTSAGGAIGRGASAQADFDANKRIQLPDMRGRFLRGTDDSAGIDSGRVNGSYQDDAFEAHTHDVGVTADVNTPVAAGGAPSSGVGGAVATASGAATSTGGTETRPTNFATRFVIKV